VFKISDLNNDSRLLVDNNTMAIVSQINITSTRVYTTLKLELIDPYARKSYVDIDKIMKNSQPINKIVTHAPSDIVSASTTGIAKVALTTATNRTTDRPVRIKLNRTHVFVINKHATKRIQTTTTLK
jgi:hypothetical protein